MIGLIFGISLLGLGFMICWEYWSYHKDLCRWKRDEESLKEVGKLVGVYSNKHNLEDRNLTTLCQSCHQRTHSRERKILCPTVS